LPEVKTAAHIGMVSLVALAALAQSTTSWHEVSKPTFSSTSTLVIVPTFVQSASGKQVTNLDADHFRLTDNEVEQKISVERAGKQPLALVVVMQTGGAAYSHLQDYRKLDAVLDYILGSSTRKMALVTFDSRPEQIWNFPTSVDGLYNALAHPKGGDHGAAIVDALSCAINLLQDQPSNFRRIILLLSQARDNGSTTHAGEVLQGLVQSGTTIYSFTFSPSPESTLLSDTIAGLMSHDLVLQAMRENTAAEFAALSGGKRMRFHDEHDLEPKVSSLEHDVHDGYTLSFHPTSQALGFHAIKVEVLNRQPLEVRWRTNYWFDGKPAD
jgi:VWFA-related protein